MGATGDDAQPSVSGPGDPTSIMTPTEFAAALAALTRRQVRGLADRSGVARSTISSWTTGQHLPNPNQIDQLRRLLTAVGVSDTDQDLWADALLRVRSAPTPRGADRTRQAPYLGLEPFDEGDTERFFGREDTVAAVVEQVQSVRADEASEGTGHRIVFLIGASGEGKSSVLRAGVAVALAALPETSVVIMAPTSDEPGALDGLGREHVVIIDQFEQVFTADRADLLDAIVAASARPDGPTVVAGVRSDFYPRLVEVAAFTTPLVSHQIVLAPMGHEAMRRAIVEPARRASVDIEPGLVEMMLSDVAPATSLDDRPNVGVLPLLSHALLETWARGTKNVLRVADYTSLGGLNGALEKTAEIAFGRLDPPAADATRDLFRRLVNIDADGLITRRHAGLDEIAGADDDGLLTTVMWHFVDARLLTVEASTLTLSHEVLLRAWSRLRSWIADDRDAIRLHRELATAAASWTEAYDDDGGLLSGGRLERAETWLASPVGARLAGANERRLIETSRERALRRSTLARRRFRRVAGLAAATSVLAVVAGVATLDARDNRRAAQEARIGAEVRDLANRSRAATDPYLATLYAVEAVQWTDEPLPVARTAWIEATRRMGRQYAVRSGTDLELAAADLAFSPDGSQLAILGRDGAVHLVDPTSRSELAVSWPAGSGVSIAWRPDGAQLVTSDGQGVVRLYDATTLQETETSTDVAITSANDVAWSPDAATIAVTNNEGSLRFLDAATLATLGEPISTGTSSAQSVAWHPDGASVVTSNFQGEMTIIDRASRRPVDTVLIAGGVVANGLGWNPAGTTIAVTSSDGMVRYYDSATRSQLGPPVSTGTSYALRVSWTADGERVATVNQDGTLRVFTSVDHRPIGEPALTGTGGANAVAWHPDGELIVTANEGGNVRFFELVDGSADATVYGARVASNPDATRLITTNFDDTIRTYDASTLEPVGDLVAGGGTDLTAVAWSPDGATIAVGSATGAVSLRDADDPAAVLATVVGPPDSVVWMAWTDDSVLTASASGQVSRLRADDLATTALADLGTPLTAAALAPAGDRVAIAGADGTVRLVSVDGLAIDGDPITTGATEATGVAWSPDGARVTTLHADGTVQIVRATGRSVEATYILSETPTAAAWNPAGDVLAIGTSTGTVWLFTDELEQLGTAVTADASVTVLLWDPDGSGLVSSHANGSTVRSRAWSPVAACELLHTVVATDEMDRLIDIPDGSSRCRARTVGEIVALPATSGRLP